MSDLATLENIKELRAILDAPYKDCIEALKANSNDMTKAAEWLKEKGKGEQRTSATNHGVIGSYCDETGYTFVVVRCETDFVARNQNFIGMVDVLAKNIRLSGEGKATNLFKEAAWIFKENIKISDVHNKTIDPSQSLFSYVHHDKTRASLVVYTGGNSDSAKKIALQICAMDPTVIDRDKVDPDKITAIFDKSKIEALGTGKPEAIACRIAEGKLNSYLKDFVLMEQPLFDDPKTTVEKFVKQTDMQIVDFLHLKV